MHCISSKQLTTDSRNEIVRDLVTHMYASFKDEDEKPVSAFCREVARKLVQKYPFMADAQTTKGGGSGYVSMYGFVYIYSSLLSRSGDLVCV